MRTITVVLASVIALAGIPMASAQQDETGKGPSTGSSSSTAQGQSSATSDAAAAASSKAGTAPGAPATPAPAQPAEVLKTKTKSNQSND